MGGTCQASICRKGTKACSVRGGGLTSRLLEGGSAAAVVTSACECVLLYGVHGQVLGV